MCEEEEVEEEPKNGYAIVCVLRGEDEEEDVDVVGDGALVMFRSGATLLLLMQPLVML